MAQKPQRIVFFAQIESGDMTNSEIRLETFSEELDKLLTAYVIGGNICIKFADELHAKVVGLFEDNSQS